MAKKKKNEIVEDKVEDTIEDTIKEVETPPPFNYIGKLSDDCIAEIKQRHEQEKKVRAEEKFKEDRRAAYPDLGDFADMYYKTLDRKLAAGVRISPEEKAWYDSCKKVKDTIKKTV